MQSFLNVLFSFGLKKLYLDKGTQNEQDHSVVYGYAVNLRKYANNSLLIDPTNLDQNMGFLTNTFVNSLRDDINFDVCLKEQFWYHVHKENDDIRKRFEQNEQFKLPGFVTGSSGDIRFDFVLSNIGIMPSVFKKESLHRVKSCYFAGLNETTSKITFSYFVTVNNLFCWSFLFNSHVIDDFIADEIIRNIKTLFCKVIEL